MKAFHFKDLVKAIILLVFMAGYFTVTGQQCINYKAVIMSNVGSPLTNWDIQLRFSIFIDNGGQGVLLYEEIHTTKTDLNAIANACIGEGTDTTGAFGAIEWDKDNYLLKVEIDTGSGFTDMGNSPIRAVPIALNANGLQKVYENSSQGWRLNGKDPDRYGDIGESAVDLSDSGGLTNFRGATGNNSFASGINTVASGDKSTAMGNFTKAEGTNSMAVGHLSIVTTSGTSAMALGSSAVASGEASLATGESTFASGFASTAMGNTASALGDNSLASGLNTRAESFASFVIGRHNNGGGSGAIWNNNDPLFEVGIGTSNLSRANALTVYKNGVVKINDAYDLPTSDGTNGQVLTTNGSGTTSWSSTISTPVNITNYGANYNAFGKPYNQPRYSKENNRVFLEGLIKASTGGINAGDVLFTLPSGYRPDLTTICLGTQTGTSTIRVDIYPDGKVIAFETSPTNYLSLNGITFRVD